MSEEITFGAWLKQRRNELGINQGEFAKNISCSLATLQKIESGERRPSGQIAQLLADYLSIPTDEREAFTTFARTDHATGHAGLISAEILPGAAHMRAPWRNVHLHRTNLPAVLTSLIGREQEEVAARNYLLQPKVRLLTITGAPGIGKTSLALQVASGLVECFDDGVFFVELAAVVDPEMVLPTVARTLGLKDVQDCSPASVLLDYLRERKMLLVLDNFEQVLDAAASIVKVLEASPWLKVLVTSREPLHVRGERRLSAPSLSVPDPVIFSEPAGSAVKTPVPSPTETVTRLASYSSVKLFVERAQVVQPEFALTAGNAGTVVEICRKLDGLPLAIELAAARMRMLSPEVLLEYLSNRLEVLTGNARDASTRHRTLRSAIEWSYDLLDEQEKRCFQLLAVLHGGATLEAIQAISEAWDTSNAITRKSGSSAHSGRASSTISDLVGSLADKSLLQHRVGRDGRPRFWMLETIREYARKKLEENAEEGMLARAHALYFADLAERTEPHLKAAKQQEWLELLQEEHGNIMAALLWASSLAGAENDASSLNGKVDKEKTARLAALEIIVRIVGSFCAFWDIRGYLNEGREQVSAALGLLSSLSPSLGLMVSPLLKAKVLNSGGILARKQGEYTEARSLFRESLDISREIDDKEGIASTLKGMGNVAFMQGDYEEATASFREGLDISREMADKSGIAVLLNSLGVIAYNQEDYATAGILYKESLTMRREIGDKLGMATALNNLANIACMQKDYTKSRTLHLEGLDITRELGNKAGIAITLGNLGYLSQEQGHLQEARAFYRESLAIRQEISEKSGIAWCLIALGDLTAGEGHPQQAAQLLGAADALLKATKAALDTEDRAMFERGAASARSQLGTGEFDIAWTEGRDMSTEEAVAYALAS